MHQAWLPAQPQVLPFDPARAALLGMLAGVSIVIAWGATLLGVPEVGGGMSADKLLSSLAGFGHVFSGFEFLGFVPHLAAWAKTQIDGALGAAGVSVTPELIAGMATGGVLYEGLALLGNGAILTGLVLAAMGVFVIERRFVHAAGFAAAGAVLSFFGFMHGPAVGIGVTPMVAVAYLIVAGFFIACARLKWVPAPVPAAVVQAAD